MLKTISILMLVITTQASAECVCLKPIEDFFDNTVKEVIKKNLDPISENMILYNVSIQKNTDEIKSETEEYKRLIKNESVVTFKLQELLFNLKKESAGQALKNQIIAENIQAILKQNEMIVVYEKKLMEKERY